MCDGPCDITSLSIFASSVIADSAFPMTASDCSSCYSFTRGSIVATSFWSGCQPTISDDCNLFSKRQLVQCFGYATLGPCLRRCIGPALAAYIRADSFQAGCYDILRVVRSGDTNVVRNVDMPGRIVFILPILNNCTFLSIVSLMLGAHLSLLQHLCSGILFLTSYSRRHLCLSSVND
jgi:hypothetical protein